MQIMVFKIVNSIELRLGQGRHIHKYREKELKLWHRIISPKERTERTEHQELNKP